MAQIRIDDKLHDQIKTFVGKAPLGTMGQYVEKWIREGLAREKAKK